MNVHVCEQRDPASVSPWKTLGRAICTRKKLPARDARGKKVERIERKKGAGERRRGGKGRSEGGAGSASIPGACTIASPWRNNGFWMSHRVQSQTAISHRGILQGNDRFAVVAIIDLRRPPLSTNRPNETGRGLPRYLSLHPLQFDFFSL